MFLFVDSQSSAKLLYDKIQASHRVTFISCEEFGSAKVNIDEHIKRLSAKVTVYVTVKEHFHANRFNVATVTELAKTAAARFGKILRFELVDDSAFAANPRLVYSIEYNSVAGVEPQSPCRSAHQAVWLPSFVRHDMEGRDLHPKKKRPRRGKPLVQKRHPRRGKLLVQKQYPRQTEQNSYKTRRRGVTSFQKTAEAWECPLKKITRGVECSSYKKDTRGRRKAARKQLGVGFIFPLLFWTRSGAPALTPGAQASGWPPPLVIRKASQQSRVTREPNAAKRDQQKINEIFDAIGTDHLLVLMTGKYADGPQITTIKIHVRTNAIRTSKPNNVVKALTDGGA